MSHHTQPPTYTAYDSAKQELLDKIQRRHHLEDRLAIAITVNFILVERLGSTPRSAAYQENRKL
jgi:hypothetical protein